LRILIGAQPTGCWLFLRVWTFPRPRPPPQSGKSVAGYSTYFVVPAIEAKAVMSYPQVRQGCTVGVSLPVMDGRLLSASVVEHFGLVHGLSVNQHH
jgi:hypothetical protein